MERLAIILLFLTPVAAYVISIAGLRKLTRKVYAETGYNGFTGKHKLISVSVVFAPLIGGFLTAGRDGTPSVAAMIIAGLVPVALLALLDLKAQKPAYIVGLLLLQVLYGVSFIFHVILKLVFKLVLRMDFQGLSVEVGDIQRTTEQQVGQTGAAIDAEMRENNERAQAYAQKKGFDSAEDAEEQGINTGLK